MSHNSKRTEDKYKKSKGPHRRLHLIQEIEDAEIKQELEDARLGRLETELQEEPRDRFLEDEV